ncbi:MAG TPA: hypothetical protein QGG32_03165 [Rhodospirillales bacterium]|jgi:hypothetical protein|nr:hypothetical protein [Rhodospirillales bacterium]
MVVFYNPKGAPELACNECGCRWYDRMTNTCYDCGTEVSDAEVAAFEKALEQHYEKTGNRP